MFYNRLRKYIGRFTKVEYEGVAEQNGKLFNYPGPSGAMSTLLPALDAFLGVEMSILLGNMIRNFSTYPQRTEHFSTKRCANRKSNLVKLS